MSQIELPFEPNVIVQPVSADVDLYTDGACSGNPGPGGYAAILKTQGRERIITGPSEGETTNNIMELTAVREGLQALTKPCAVKVHTDSRLVVGWLRDHWRRKDSECAQVLREIDEIVKTGQHVLTFELVIGHNGNPMNERCDELAKAAIYR